MTRTAGGSPPAQTGMVEPQPPPPLDPDPSLLATESLLREVSHLRDFLEARIDGLERLVVDHEAQHVIVHRDVVDAAIQNVHVRLTEKLNERDLRFEQRYVAQTEAVEAAFTAQQSATVTALAAADKAVTSALAAADRAVAKAEALNERRFESLNETTAALATLSDGVNELRARVDGLDRLTDAKFVTFRTLVEANATQVAIALQNADKAVGKAEAANERRFDAVNEFRQSLGDQSALMMSRTEVNALVTNLSSRLDEAQKTTAVQISDLKEYKAGNTATALAGRQSIAYLFAAIAALTGLVGIALAVIANAGH